MDRLRRDLRDVFSNRQSEFPDVAASRQRVMRAGMAARGGTMDRGAQLIAGLATMAIAAILVGTFVYIRSGNTRHPSPVAPITSGKPSPAPTARQPAGYVVYDAEVSDSLHGLALLTNCIQPMTGKCHYFVTSTVDGGRTWSRPVQVGGDFDPTDGGAPRNLRFLSASDGFVYGGTAAFVTHDGGLTWSKLVVPVTYFAQMGGAGTNVWITTWPCPKGDPACSYQLLTSTDSGRSWSPPKALPHGFYPYRMVSFGQAGFFATDESPGDIEISLDGGVTWSATLEPCGASTLESVVGTDGASALWQLCVDYKSGASTAPRLVFVSNDGGVTWTRHAISSITVDQASSGFFQVIASPMAGSAVIASNQTSMSITHDGGRSWHAVGPSGVGFSSIRFVSSSIGVAVDVTHGTWVTTDGGDHWTEWTVSLPQA